MFLTPQDGARIARELKATIGHDVNIMDRRGVIIASTDPSRVGQSHTIAKKLMLENLPMLEVSETDAAGGIQAGVNLPIHVGGVCEGVIGITGPASQVRIFGTIAKKMAEILLTTMDQQRQQALLERARSLFIEEWLFAREQDWPAFALRGELLGIDVEQPRRVAVFLAPATGGEEAGGAPREFRSEQFLRMMEPCLREDTQSHLAVVNRQILLLLGTRSQEAAPRILEEIQREGLRQFGVQLAGGLSSVSHGGEDLRRCYTEAKIAAAVSARDGHIRQYSNSSLDFVLQNIDPTIKRDVLQTVFPPQSVPERAILLECLRLYFKYDGNVDAAAGEACVHPNTFRYRMRKLEQLTGYDLHKPKDTVMLYLALQFMA